VWFKPIMLGLMILGLVGDRVLPDNQALPIPGIAGWNLVIGFGSPSSGSR
jgi:hypothetical protein